MDIVGKLQHRLHVLRVSLRVLIKTMARVVVTLAIMPESPNIDLSLLEEKSRELIVGFAGQGDSKTEIVPVAFGLQRLNILFVMDEVKGSTEALEKQIAALPGVNSVEVTDVRRTIG